MFLNQDIGKTKFPKGVILKPLYLFILITGRYSNTYLKGTDFPKIYDYPRCQINDHGAKFIYEHSTFVWIFTFRWPVFLLPPFPMLGQFKLIYDTFHFLCKICKPSGCHISCYFTYPAIC